MLRISGRKVIWVGDINIDQQDTNNTAYKKLDITMQLFGLKQVVTGPTRISYRQNVCTESLIDVVMTTCQADILNCKVLDDRIGDHQTLKFDMNFQVCKADKFRKILIRDHCRKNLELLKYHLNEMTDYTHILSCVDAEAIASCLNQHVDEAYKYFCPEKVIKCHNNYLHKPSKELLYNIKKKKQLFRKYKKAKIKNPNSAKCKKLWDEYKMFKNKNVTKLSRRDRKQNIINDLKEKSIKNDLKGIWKTIKMASNLSVKSSNNHVNKLNEDDLNKHFISVGTEIQAKIPCYEGDNFLEYMPDNTSFLGMSSFEQITEDMVIEYVKKLPSDKSINDTIPMKIYKSIMISIKNLSHMQLTAHLVVA